MNLPSHVEGELMPLERGMRWAQRRRQREGHSTMTPFSWRYRRAMALTISTRRSDELQPAS
jgi:hypothetical protein